MNRLLLPFALLSIATCALADTDSGYSAVDHGHSIIIGGGPSLPLLGSWERRAGGLLEYSNWRPEPKLRRFFGPHIDSVWGFYEMYHSGRDGRYDPDPTWATGFTYGYRKSWVNEAGAGFATQVYWGGIDGFRASHDLPSQINSTPGIIVSWLRPFGARDLNANLQYMHMSNAGTDTPNRGENFFMLTLEFKLH